jgi:signal transduction histidine kinase
LDTVIGRDEMVDELAKKFMKAVPLDKALDWISGSFEDDESFHWRDCVRYSIDEHLQEIPQDFEATVKRMMQEAIANR